MSNFLGYLLSFNGNHLNNSYISIQSFKVYPDQRIEIDAYRDANNLLHRITSTNFKTKIEFNSRGNMRLDEKKDMFNTIRKGLINETQKSYKVTYWNDDISEYKTGIFYMPNVEYTIKRISSNDILYEPIRIAFIEY